MRRRAADRPHRWVTKGKSYQFGSGLIAVARQTVDAAATFLGAIEGAVVASKAVTTGVTFAIGGPVYYDATNKLMTNKSTGNTKCGYALEAAATAAVTTVTMMIQQSV